MAARRRPRRPGGTAAGSTLTAVVVMAAVLAALLLGRWQLAQGLSRVVEETTAVPTPDAGSSGTVGIEIYDPPGAPDAR